MIREHQINLNIFRIIGLPGETEETFKETFLYIEKLAQEKLISNIFMSHFQPYFCTKAYKDLKKYGGKIIVENTDYSKWIFRSKPLVEYNHLNRKRLEEMFEALSKTQPIGRMGKPEEIGSLALYLCSDEASFITGSCISIDGGFITLNT